MDSDRSLKIVSAAIGAFFLALFCLVLRGVFRGFSARYFVSFLKSGYFLRMFSNSVRIALVSALVSVFAGGVLAFAMGRRDFAFSGTFMRVSAIPFAMPSVIMVMAFVSVFGRGGILKGAFSPFPYDFCGIIALHAFYNFPLSLSMMRASLREIPERRLEAALSLGGGWLENLCLIVFPAVAKSASFSFLLVFSYCFSSFSTVLLFGGMSCSNIETEMYRSAAGGNPALFSSVSAVSLLTSLLFFAAFAGRNDLSYGEGAECEAVRERRPARTAVAAVLSAFVLFPFASVAVMSFGGGGFGGYAEVVADFASVAESVLFSVAVAFVSVSASLFLAAYERRGGRCGRLVLFFQTLSPVLISAGFRKLGAMPLFFAHFLLVTPFSFMLVRSSYSKYPLDRIREASLLGGGDFLSVLFVEADALAPALANAFAYSFVTSAGDVVSGLMLSAGSVKPLGSLIYSAMGHYRFSLAAALSCCMAVAAVFVRCAGEAVGSLSRLFGKAVSGRLDSERKNS